LGFLFYKSQFQNLKLKVQFGIYIGRSVLHSIYEGG